MPYILSVATHSPPYKVEQQEALQFAKQLFSAHFTNIERLLQVFHNAQIESRHFSVPLEWFTKERSFQEKNDMYIDCATKFGTEVIIKCLQQTPYLKKTVHYEHIDAIFCVTSSGISTPSIEARIMNKLPFSEHTKRVPIWGLGCAGGGAGLARANEYCLAYPQANVLVLSIELCSLTFQHDDLSKSNLVGTSIFADGVACALVAGDRSPLRSVVSKPTVPAILDGQSTFMRNSEEVMGWDVQENGLYVVFSKNIPRLVKTWLQPKVDAFLAQHQLSMAHIRHFVAHPGGRKVLDAYRDAFGFNDCMNDIPRAVLRRFGNMSSATVLFVLEAFMQKHIPDEDKGLLTALGPGFSSEMLLLEWRSSRANKGGKNDGVQRRARFCDRTKASGIVDSSS
jgi:alkylresorcinol/alkylpyrone synthase